MSRRLRLRRPAVRVRGLSVWIIALLVALVATVQIRSQAELERSLVGVDTTSLAFLIDDLHSANDTLSAQTSSLTNLRAKLESGQSGAADQALNDEAQRLRAIDGYVPVQGPGVVMEVDARGLGALDLEDAINNFMAAGAEAIDVNDRRVVTGVAVSQDGSSVTIGGGTVATPWTISVIGDPTKLGEVADLMAQQLRADRRVRSVAYSVENNVVITSVVSERPFVYAIPS